MTDDRGASDVFPPSSQGNDKGSQWSDTSRWNPELVAQNETGLLVRARCAHTAAAIAQLTATTRLRHLRRRPKQNQQFTIENTIEPLLQRFPTGNKAAAAR
jgi:hypothetical protein